MPVLLQKLSQAIALSSRFSATVIAGGVLGMVADHVLGYAPAGLLIGTLFGMAAGTWTLLRALQRNFTEQPPNDSHSAGDRT